MARKMCATQGSIFSLFLGISEDAKLCPFYGVRRCPDFPKTIPLTPTRCRDLHLKQFCLEDIVPAVLIILIAHIILAIRWMLIKILSVVINDQRSHKVIVPGGCYFIKDIICKIALKIKMLWKIRCADLRRI